MSVKRQRSQVPPSVPGSFVAYLRTSSDDQRLGIEAQRSIIERHVQASGGTIVAEFVEHASGKDRDRPQLAAALELCRESRSTLIVAKQCRLTRDVEHMAWLIKQPLSIVCCDAPHAGAFELHLRAALSHEERRLIAARTAEALGALKEKGVKLGGAGVSKSVRPNERIAVLAAEARTRAAVERAWRALPAITEARDSGCANAAQIAERLRVHPMVISRTLNRTVGSLFAA